MVGAEIKIWGHEVGAVVWDENRNLATMEFSKSFVDLNLDIAPVMMPLDDLDRGSLVWAFPSLGEETFKRLPGLLADSLPDKFGNNLIDLWLARNGRSPNEFSPVERLCYTGNRGMGAVEYIPNLREDAATVEEIQMNELVEIAREVVHRKEGLATNLSGDKKEALHQIIQVGTSAGGMRPKAIIAIRQKDQKIVSGQLDPRKGYEHWIVKFDGVQDEIFGEPQGYGIIEYIYYLMALDAGIDMTECKLLEENGRSHFMTKRFDRVDGKKIHMQTLCGIAHYDFNDIGATSYEQLFQIMRWLRLGVDEATQMFRRMVFNVVARNQDDHTKNTAFLLEEKGHWKLSPAYDVAYSYNPNIGRNTNKHQMSINGKRENITRKDLTDLAYSLRIKKPNVIINEVVESIAAWRKIARSYGLDKKKIERIESTLILDI